MRDDLARATTRSPSERIVVTGWPQTDVFRVRRSRDEFDAIVESARARSRAPPSSSSRGTRRRTHRTRAVRRTARRAGRRARRARRVRSFSFARIRATASGASASPRRSSGEDTAVQEPSLHRPRSPRDAPPARGLRRRERGDDPARRLVNDRPAVCVLYDEGAPEGERHAELNVTGQHYEELDPLGRVRSGDGLRSGRGRDRAVACPPDRARGGAETGRRGGRRRGRRPCGGTSGRRDRGGPSASDSLEAQRRAAHRRRARRRPALRAARSGGR